MDANENRIKSPNGLKAAKVQPLEIDESFPIKKALPSNAADSKDNWSGKLDFFLSALSFSGQQNPKYMNPNFLLLQ